MNIYQKELIDGKVTHSFSDSVGHQVHSDGKYLPECIEMIREVCNEYGINFELISFMLRGKHQELISIDTDGTIISVDKKGVEHTHYFSTIQSPAGVTEVVK